MTTYTDVFGSDAVPSTLTGYVEVMLSANTQFYWPEINSDANLIADIMDVTASGVYNLIMPPANQVSSGRNVLINNVGAQSFYVVDADNTTLALVEAGQVKCFYLIDNSDVAGLWRAFTFGTGTSSADASLLRGNGLTVIGGKLAQMAENRSVDTSTTLVANDRASSYVFSSSGAVTCNLLQASVAGDGYFVMLANQGSGSVTLDPYSAETIDGASTKALAPGESCIAVCDGNNWVTVGYGRSTEFQFTKLVLDVTTGSPFTLSSSQAQNKLIQFIGSPSADVILNVPKVVSVYYIQGAFSGSNYVQVQTTTGDYVRVFGTDRVIVYCDGEDVVLAQTTAIPATDLAGGVAGSLVCQVGIGDTDFTLAGVSGQVLRSAGTGKPVWDDLTASDIANIPSGNIVATNVQAAVNELDTEKAPLASPTFTGTVTAPQNFNVTQSYGALQVGAADVLRFGSDTSGHLAGFRNKLINGDARIWQRGVQINAAGYFLDRWQIETFGSGATGQYAQQGDTVGTDLEGITRKNIAFSRTGGTSLVRLSQRIEDARTLAGKTVTLSFWGRVNAGSLPIYPRLDQKFGTGGSPSTDTSTVISSCNLTTTSTLFTRTVTLPSVVGKTFGSNNDSSLALLLDTPDAGGFDVRITNVQLEEGSIATPFEQRPIGLELALCQRYYQKYGFNWTGYQAAGQVFNALISHVGGEMRVAPAVTVSGTGSVNITSPAVGATTTAIYQTGNTAVLGSCQYYGTASLSAEL